MADPGDLRVLIRQIDIPKKAGRVSQRNVPLGEVAGVVAHIQDLHGNFGVQLHEAKIIKHLVRFYGFRQVFVEGASGPGDLTQLCAVPALLRHNFSIMLLRKALMTGVEYIAANAPDVDFDLCGIDDADKYRRNFEPAEGTYLVQDQAVQTAQELKDRLNRWYRPLTSKPLRELLDAIDAYDYGMGNMNEATFLRRLWLLSLDYSVAIRPVVQQRMASYGLTPHDVAPTAAASFAAKALDPILDDEINGHLKDLCHNIAQAIGKPNQQTPDNIDLWFYFLYHLADLAMVAFQLHLQPGDVLQYFTFDADHLPKTIRQAVENLNRNLGSNIPPLKLPDDFEVIVDNWDLPRQFYQMARWRSGKMMDNINHEMRRRGIDRAILITGGFHSDYIVRNLRDLHNIGSVVLTPTVKKLDDRAHKKRMLEDRSQSTELTIADTRSQALKMFGLRLVTSWGHAVTQPPHDYLRMQAEHVMLELLALHGDEVVLEIVCHGSRLYPTISKRLRMGYIVTVDRFDHYMGGTDIPVLSPLPTWHRAQADGDVKHIEIMNGNPPYLGFQNGVFDVVLSSAFHRIVRVNDKRKAIRELARTLKSGGTVLLYGYHCANLCAHLLLEAGITEVFRLHTVPLLPQGYMLYARKPGGAHGTENGYLQKHTVQRAALDANSNLVWL